MTAKASTRSPYEVIESRVSAIGRAMELAQKDDVIVLCGKGHETYEIDRTGRHPFDERAVVREALRSRGEE